MYRKGLGPFNLSGLDKNLDYNTHDRIKQSCLYKTRSMLQNFLNQFRAPYPEHLHTQSR